MDPRPFLRAALALLLAFAFVAPPALADEAPVAEVAEEPAAEDEAPPNLGRWADDRFGAWVVGPIATVLMYDVWFWDNHLRGAEHVGRMLPSEEAPEQQITDWHPDEGYTVKPLVKAEVAELVPRLDAPVVRTVGEVEVEIRDEEGELKARLLPAEVDLEALGILLGEDGEPVIEGAPHEAPTDSVVVDTLAPFPITVDVREGRLVEQEVEVPTDAFTLTAGMQVWHEGAQADVIRVDGEGGALLRLTGQAEQASTIPNPENVRLPFVVLWLVLGAVFFTVRMAFVNVRAFGHALACTTGRYTAADDPGEISHFQALAAALSATVGLGNIAGVAIAIAVGGPGAVFWMVTAGFLGMSAKFTECTLGQMYREVSPDGTVSGGPMQYLSKGLAELGLGPLGKVLAVLFAIMCIGGSFGGGNMFQANQAFAAVSNMMPAMEGQGFVFGLLLAIAVGVVIIGGIKSIGRAASIIVPVMCGIYMVAGAWILLVNASAVPTAFATILTEAFAPVAVAGGFIGVIVQGFQRAAFSSEAGIGSAAIAHSAASTKEPVREGVVALLEPFIDTVLVCTMTGLVVVITGVYLEPIGDGVLMTSQAFGSVLPWFPAVLTLAVVLFAFSTMISWSYYGERCATWLLGDWAALPYKLIFLVFVVFGAVFQLGNVLDFSDLMILGMALPNIAGAVLLSGKVKRALDAYMGKLRRGEFEVHGAPRAKASGE